MRLIYLPLWTGLVPIVGILISYVVAAASGHVLACVPFVEGCTSISSTGRQPPESFFFRATVIPGAVLVYLYWQLNHQWLKATGDPLPLSARLIPRLGLAAALFLIVYATVLGNIGELYALQRRIGVTLFFSLNLLAQLLFTKRLITLQRTGVLTHSGHIVMVKQGIGVLMILVGLLVFPKYLVGWDTDNIVEWNFALLTQLYYVTTYFLWRNSRFAARYSVSNGAEG